MQIIFGWDVERCAETKLIFDFDLETDEPFDWKYVEFFLTPEEKLLLRLIKEGKGPSDIATIFHLHSRQYSFIKMRRLFSIIRYYTECRDGIEKLLRGDLPLYREEVIFLQRRFLWRMKFADIMKNTSRSGNKVYRLWRVIQKKLEDRNVDLVLEVVRGFDKMIGKEKHGEPKN